MSRRPPTSPLQRMLRLGGLAGRVGASVLGSRALDISRSAAEQRRRRAENLTRNAARVAETLGELKGAAMKVGQMVSLHDGILPSEVAEVLRQLQNEAPKVPFAAMEAQLRSELPDFDELFAELEPEAFAAASIGQVHRGVLRDGREVAVKMQYPEIDQIVKADLVNLRRVLKSLFALVSEAEFEPVWQELNERLLEELDYRREAEHAELMAQLDEEIENLLIPKIVAEASSRRVLTLEYCPGLSADEACSEDYGPTTYGAEPYGPALRDSWGRALFEFIGRGILVHGFLHADPNLANFAFRDDGTVIVYDFGCMKRVPESLIVGYRRLARAALEVDPARIPEILMEMEVIDEAGGPVGRDLTDPYVALFSEIFRAEPAYRFGADDAMYDELIELGLDNWSQQLDVRFPKDILFVQRALGGHFANLWRLGAAAPWRETLEELLEQAEP